MMKTKDNILSILKFMTNFAFFAALGAAAVFLILFLISLISPAFVQNSISLPAEFHVKDAGGLNFEDTFPEYHEILTMDSIEILFKTKDVYIFRVLITHYFLIACGLGVFLFFWKKIFYSFLNSSFYSKENQVRTRFLGWLLVIASPVLVLENLIICALIDYRIQSESYVSAIGRYPTNHLILIFSGLLMLFVSRIAKKHT